MTVRKREYKNRNGQQIWDYDFWFNNHRYRKAGFATKAEATLAETRARQLVYSGKKNLRPSTFSDLAEPFLEYRKGRVASVTWINDKNRLNTMLPHFGSKKITHITNAYIDAFISQRRKEGKAPQTINHAINLLSSVFTYAVSHGFAYENPIKEVQRLKMVQIEPTMPTNEQFRALIEGARKTEVGLELATWLIFRGYTGTRPTESFFMEWRDIDFERNQVTIRPKDGNPLKNGKARVLPLSIELRVALLEWKKEWDKTFGRRKRHDWIFFNPRFPYRQCRSFRKSYPRAQKNAGMTEYMTSHCLRHFFISRAVEAGINFLVIAKWVGHSSTAMIEQVYAHLSPEFKNGEMNKLQLGLVNGTGNQDVAGKKVDSQVA